MAAAIALAVVLVIAVAGLSLAMQTQRPLQSSGRPRNLRPTISREGRSGEGVRRPRRQTPKPPPAPDPPPPAETVASAQPVPKGPELLRSGVPSMARVVSVVDERVVGPVTRSRLTLQLDPDGMDAFEVTIRHAFPSAEARGAVKVGGTIPVRYDRDRPQKVVIDPAGGSADSGPGPGGPTPA